jgi:DUF4097 and DUF4098 domain-containing protein YvlB
MSTHTVIHYAVGLAFALGVLTACGDVNVGSPTIDGAGSALLPAPSNAAFSTKQDFSQEMQVENHMRMRLEAVNGEIVITGQPDATSVIVTAELCVSSHESQQDAEARLEQLEVLVTDLSDEIVVETLQPDNTEGRQYVVNYTITVPSNLEVDVNQVNGAIRVEDTTNSVFVNVVNGSLDSTVSLPPNGQIRLSMVNGDVDLRLPTSTSAELSAFVDNGTITWDNLDLLDAVHTNQSLTGTLGSGAGVIWLETTNGSIDVIGVDN